jgi:hypothetical protein
MFFNMDATMSNWDHFLDESVERPSYRWNQNFQVAHDLLRRSVRITKLRPIELDISNKDLIWSDGSKSAGAIGVGSKDTFAKECFDAASLLRERIASGDDFDDIWIPYLQLHRAQISNLVDSEDNYTNAVKHKDRLVFACDGGTVTLEGLYSQPLIRHVSRYWFSYSGGDNPDELRSKIRSSAHQRFWMSLDFSKFDQTIQGWLIDDAFSIIKEFYHPQHYRELDWIAYQFKHSRLISSRGVFQKHRGIPSGSSFTQLVGSMCNALMILTYIASRAPRGCSYEERVRYVEEEIGFTSSGRRDYGKFSMFVMGDDNLLFTRRKIDANNLSKYVERVFGVKISPEKTDQGVYPEPPKYLKREWRYNGEYRNPIDLAVNVCHPEWERHYDAYSPWHIMYGLYLTYSCAFPSYVSERYLYRKMSDYGGVQALEKLEFRTLPGVLKGLGYNVKDYLRVRAESLDSVKSAI